MLLFTVGCVSSERTTTQTTAKSISGDAETCSVQCPDRTAGATGGHVTCRDHFVAVCECNPHPEPIAYCVPEGEKPGGTY
jgi:hypothetical protein